MNNLPHVNAFVFWCLESDTYMRSTAIKLTSGLIRVTAVTYNLMFVVIKTGLVTDYAAGLISHHQLRGRMRLGFKSKYSSTSSKPSIEVFKITQIQLIFCIHGYEVFFVSYL